MTEEDLRQETPPREVVHPKGNVKNRAKITSKEIVRIRRVKIDILRVRVLVIFLVSLVPPRTLGLRHAPQAALGLTF